MLVRIGTDLGRKVMTVLMVMTMAFTIIPMMGRPSYANRAYFLWIGGVKVTGKTMSGEGWSFDENSNTLTLSNANITQGRSVGGDYCGIYYEGSDYLNIILKGSNSIKSAQGGTSLTHGIYSQNKYANINISGEGSLSTDATNIGIYAGQDVIINGGSITVSGATGIRADRNVEIEGGTVTATATGDNGNAIYAANVIDLKGGSVTASGAGIGHGIYATGIDKIGNNVVIWAGDNENSASDVTDKFKKDYAKYKWVQAEKVTLWVGGIPVTDRNASDILGDIDEGATASYDDSTKILTLNNYNYESEGYKYVNYPGLTGQYAVVYADQKLTIQLEGDNTVKCTKTDNSIGNGIHVAGEDGDLIITGNGTLTASAYGNEQGWGGVGIYARNGDIEFNGGTVNALGDTGIGISTDKKDGYVRINSGIVTASGNDRGFSGTHVTHADGMGINAGDSKESAVAVDKKDFESNHLQSWVQIAKAYDLWVGGKRVMVSNASNITGEGNVTASYDAESNILTLNNYNYKGPGFPYLYDNYHSAICSDVGGKDFTVKLIGDNNLEIVSTGDYNLGIHHDKANYDVKFTGDGNLNIVCEPAKISSKGISSNGDIVIDGPSLDIDAGSKGYGIYCQKIKSLSIKGAYLTARGGKGAIAGTGTVKNSIAGLGWINMEGSEGKTEIKINEEGQSLGDGIKKVVFPASGATVTSAPTSKVLTYNGSAQELVAAGAASDGMMQYALGENDKSEPTNAWSTSIPEGTSAGDYYVWYRADGDNTHLCSDAACVKVVINRAKITIKADDKNCADKDKTDSLTWTMEDEENKWYEAERADIGFSVTDDKGNVVDPKSSPAGKYTITPRWNNENKNYEATFVPGVFDTNHKYGEWKELDDKQHQRVCEHDSNHVEKEDHSWDEGKVTKLATCTEEGEKTYTCAVCLATKKEAIPAIEHKFGEWKELDDKQHQKVCEHDSNHAEKEDHSWDEGKVTKPATCTEAGEKTYTCAVCLATKKEAVPAIEHKFGEWKELDDKQHQRVCEHDSGHVEKEDHRWDEGKVTKEATEQEEGEKVYSCVICQAEKTEVIAKVKPAPLVIPKAGGTQLAKVTTGKKSITIGWDKVQEASGYDIFFSQCNHHGKKLVYKNVKSIKGNDIFTWKMSGLKKGTAYKAYVKAYVMKGGKKYYVKTSPTMHAYTGGGTKRYTNVKSVSVKKAKVSLKKGKTYKIKASLKKLHRGKRLMPKSHVPRLRYLSTDSSVATVNAKGKITAKGKGSCTIYVYAHNGVRKAVKVKVD